MSNSKKNLTRLRNVHGTDKLQFNSLQNGRDFAHPKDILLGGDIVCPTYSCITHGDVNETNILIDENGDTWLIDFARTGYGHILRDVAELDAVVRFHLLGGDLASLSDRLLLESSLLSVRTFDQFNDLPPTISADNPHVAKAYATTLHIRKVAASLVTRNPGADLVEYYTALFFYALKELQFYNLSKIQREHALLSASLLSDHLR